MKRVMGIPGGGSQLLSSPTARGIICLLATAGAVMADALTGNAYHAIGFYLIPVIYAAWKCEVAYGVVATAATVLGPIIFELRSPVAVFPAAVNAAAEGATLIALYVAIKRAQLQFHILNQTNGRLEAANRAKAALFRIISHDLTTPFNAILGYAELLEERINNSETADDQTKKYVKECRDAAKAAYSLLRHLLEWAKVQMHATERLKTNVSVADVVQSCVKALQPAAALKSISLRQMATDEGLSVMGDRPALQTVLRNLIDNAIKFTEPGGEVTVDAERRENVVEISVADTGRGIPDANLDSIFEYSSNTSTPGTKGEIGSGLGLPLCRELIEQHGGSIAASTATRGGTLITVKLPRNH